MGYNRKNLKRIREEYDTKYIDAQRDADRRLDELHKKIPELEKIDRLLAATGLKIVDAAINGKEDCERMIKEIREENLALQREREEMLKAHGYSKDYTDIRYECGICKDSGYINGKMCSCMKRKLIEAGYESSGIAYLMKEQGFDTFSLDYYKQSRENFEYMSLVLERAKRYAEEFGVDDPVNLAFMGGTGLGKTHLSSAIARRVIERGYDVLYTTAVTMISDFEFQRFGNGISGDDAAEDIGRYFDCELLIIDDLGTEVSNQFTTACVYNIINTRLNKRKSTIISTNLLSKEFQQRYWDRITSRVFGEYEILLFRGIDVRAQKLKQ